MKFENGDPVKFFDSRYPDKWRHPYFLITAGHHYKKMDFRDTMGLEKDVHLDLVEQCYISHQVDLKVTFRTLKSI